MEENEYHPVLPGASDGQLLDQYSATVTGVVRSSAQAVVHIKVIKKGFHPVSKKPVELPASGSGFVISTDGYVVTNDHVIERSDSIKISFADGLELNAELIGSDPSSDIAVIKVYGGDLK